MTSGRIARTHAANKVEHMWKKHKQKYTAR